MSPFASEFLAAAVFVFLGSAVMANARLARTAGVGLSWQAIAAGCGAALALAFFVVRGRACVDPAIAVAMWSIDRLPAGELTARIAGEMAGALLGGVVAWVAFLPQWARMSDAGEPVAADVPAIPAPLSNLVASSAGAACLCTVLLRILAGQTLPDAGGAEPDLAPAAATPFIALHPGEGALVAGVALAAVLVGVGGAGVPFLVLGPSVHPGAWRSAAARRSAWLRIVGPVAGAFAAAAAWRATVG